MVGKTKMKVVSAIVGIGMQVLQGLGLANPAPVAQNPAATRWGNPSFLSVNAPGMTVMEGANGEHQLWLTRRSESGRFGITLSEAEFGDRRTRAIGEFGMRFGPIGPFDAVDVGARTTSVKKPGKPDATTNSVGARVALGDITLGALGTEKGKPAFGIDFPTQVSQIDPLNLNR